MSFGLFLIILCVVMYIALRLGINWYMLKYPSQYALSSDCINAASFYLLALAGSSVIYILFKDFFPIGIFLVWAFGGWVVFCLEQKQFPLKRTLLYQFLIVLFSVLVSGYFPLEFTFSIFKNVFLIALLGMFFWRVFVFFDRFPIVSFLVMLSWIIPLFGVGFLQNFPMEVMVQSVFLGVIALASMQINFKQKSPCLGRISSSLVGFLWMIIWCYFLAKGAIIQTISMYGYYLFEILILLLAFLRKKPLETFLFHLVKEKKFATKAISVVFYHLLILSFFGTMAMRMNGKFVYSLILFVMGIIFADLYVRLNAFENPVPTWGQLFSDTKKGVLSIADQFKKKTQKKKKASSKISSGKTVKKKVTRKK